MLPAYVSDGLNRGAIVVPDAVARVVLGPVRLTDRSITRRLAPIAGASAVVEDNVAVFQLSGLTVRNLQLRSAALRHFFTQGSGPPCRLAFAMYRLPAESPVVWLAPDGRVVNHFLLHFYVYVGTHDPAPGTVDLPPGCGASG